MTITEKLITPILAEHFLTKNTENRRITQSNVDFLTDQMKKGLYKENTGETIKFSKTGKLIDGQHRLLAIVKSGKSFKFTIAEDLEDTVFHVLDTGKTRNTGDVLSIQGFKYANILAGAVKFILSIEQNISTKLGQKKYPNELIIKYIDKNPDMEDICSIAQTNIYSNFRVLSPSTIAGLYKLMLSKGHSDEVVSNFFEKYSTGLGIGPTSPIYLLRSRFIEDSINKSKLKTIDKIALLIYTFNLYIKGRVVGTLKIPNEFPKII